MHEMIRGESREEGYFFVGRGGVVSFFNVLRSILLSIDGRSIFFLERGEGPGMALKRSAIYRKHAYLLNLLGGYDPMDPLRIRPWK